MWHEARGKQLRARIDSLRWRPVIQRHDLNWLSCFTAYWRGINQTMAVGFNTPTGLGSNEAVERGDHRVLIDHEPPTGMHQHALDVVEVLEQRDGQFRLF